jgi:hypothetical protein
MPSSGMLRHVDLVRADVSEECSTSIIRVTRIGELGTTLAVTSNRCMLLLLLLLVLLLLHILLLLLSMYQLLGAANIIPSSQILVILMMEVTPSSETPVLQRATR